MSVKLSGFSLVRNGVLFDYPFEESIRSALPLVDEFVINVGRGEDETLKRVQNLSIEEGSGKIKIFESDWPLHDAQKKKDGLILSEQTNLALERCSHDWCLYLQADEVLHEKDLASIQRSLQEASTNAGIEGLLFDYLHFYGSFDVIQQSRSAYRREVRVIKKSSGGRSIGDAQSFRKPNGDKLEVLSSGAQIFHYGWVRTPEAMQQKTFFFDQLYHGEPDPEDVKNLRPHTGDNYRYKRFWGLRPFLGTHPGTMHARIKNKGWHWDLKNSPWVWNWKDLKKVTLDLFERLTGVRLFEYKSYHLMKASPSKKKRF
jgi:hypothetical protein